MSSDLGSSPLGAEGEAGGGADSKADSRVPRASRIWMIPAAGTMILERLSMSRRNLPRSFSQRAIVTRRLPTVMRTLMSSSRLP